MKRLCKLLIGLFTLLSAIDLLTTYFILKAGGMEMNPIFTANPSMLIPAKIVAIVLIAAITMFAEFRIGEWASLTPASANVVTGLAAIHNLLILGAIS